MQPVIPLHLLLATAAKVLCSAVFVSNRDETEVANGETFDIARPEIRHLSFALGAHYCLGAPLARAEAQAAIGGVVQRFPDLRLPADESGLRYRDTLVLRGLEALPVEV